MNLKIPLLLCSISFCSWHHISSQSQTKDRMSEIPGSTAGRFYEGKDRVLYNYTSDCTKSWVYKSTDEGKSWDPIVNISFPKESEFNLSSDGTLFTKNHNEAYYSTDNGDSWTPFQTSNWSSYKYLCGSSVDNIFVLVGSAVYRSTSQGANWTKVINNVNGTKMIFYQDPSTQFLYICSENEIFQSKNLGMNWNSLFKDRFSGVEMPRMISGANNRIYLAGHDYIWVLSNQGTLRTKTNLVKSSQRMVHLCQTDSGRLMAFEFSSNYYSDNEGGSWKEYNNSSGLVLNQLFHSSFGVLFGTADHNSGIYRSEDRGQSWQISTKGIQGSMVMDILHLTKDRYFVMNENGYYLTEDGGRNYILIHQLKSRYYLNAYSKYKLMCVLGDHFFYADGNEIYRYHIVNGQKKLIYTITQSGFNGMACNASNQMLFFSTRSNLYRSSDLGDRWVKLRTPVTVESMGQPIITNEALVINIGPSIYRSMDYGNQWTRTGDFPDFVDVLHSPYPSMIYFVQRDSLGYTDLFQSFDAGLSWLKFDISDPLPNREEFAVWINNQGDLFLKGFGGEVYRSFDMGQSFALYHDIGENETGIFVGDDQRLYVKGNCFFYRLAEPTSDRKIAKGILFKDDDQNCNQEPTESAQSGVQIRVSDANLTRFLYSNPVGEFYFEPPAGDFELEASNISKFQNSCILKLNGASLDFTKTIELGLQELKKCSEPEVDLSIPLLRRCFESTIYLRYGNKGTDIAKKAEIELILDPYLVFVRSSHPNVLVNGDTVRFILGDLPRDFYDRLEITVKVSCTAQLGQKHCIEASIGSDVACDPESSAIIKTSASCMGDSVLLTISNLSSVATSSLRSWKLLELDQNSIQTIASGFFKLKGFENKSFSILASEREQLFSAEQEESYPYNKVSQTPVSNCLNHPGFRNSIDEDEPFYDLECRTNVGSYDPNDITGLPHGLGPDKRIEDQQELEYTIRFQNTGTDTAFHVAIVNDLRTTNLDPGSIVLGSSSHPYVMSLVNGNSLIFSFNNIMLPDSHVNPIQSNGFFKYKIKPRKQLPRNIQLQNRASIYFDYNDPVETNTELHTIGLPLVSSDTDITPTEDIAFFLSPNPVFDFVRLHFTGVDRGISRFEIRDLWGRRAKWVWYDANSHIVDIRNCPVGIYFVYLEMEDGRRLCQKLVKQ